jgi:hypothetical protein
MSALPPKADIGSATAHVCYGPKADMTTRRAPLYEGKTSRSPDDAQVLPEPASAGIITLPKLLT